MAIQMGSGMSKNLFTSLATLLFVILLAITLGSVTDSSTGNLDKQSSSISENIIFDTSLEARSLLTNSSLLVKRPAPLPGSPDTYTARILKGLGLSCKLILSIDTAARGNGGVSLESTITDPALFQTEGWVETMNPAWPKYGDHLDDAFMALGINPDHNLRVVMDFENQRAGTIISMISTPPRMVQTFPTEAKFENVMYPQFGAMVADANESPAGVPGPPNGMGPFRRYDINNPGNVLPPISQIYQWSDAAWLEWTLACRMRNVPLNSLRYIFRSNIQNENTRAMIIYALQELGAHTLFAGYANRFTFTKAMPPLQGGRAYYALLGSKNGAGCGFLALQHKAALGVMDIASISVWHGQDAVDDDDDSSSDGGGDTPAVDFPLYNADGTPVDPYNVVAVDRFWPNMLFTLQPVQNPA